MKPKSEAPETPRMTIVPPAGSVAQRPPAQQALETPGLPGDYEPIEALILSLPDLIHDHPRTLLEILAATNSEVPVMGLYNHSREAGTLLRMLANTGGSAEGIHLVRVPTDTAWIRDYGPFFVRIPDGGYEVADLFYGTYGARVRTDDNEVPSRLGRLLGLPVRKIDRAVDGGNLVSNGAGLVLTTRNQSVANHDMGTRNWQVIEFDLRQKLHFETCLMLPHLAGEATGHVDMYLTFVRPDLVLVSDLDPEIDEVNARRLDLAAKALRGVRTPHGPLRVERIPMPAPDGHDWRSYTNVIYTPRKVLVPVFATAPPGLQTRALETFRRLCPDREVTPIAADTLVRRHGYLHCISLGVPAGVDLRRLLSGPAAARLESLGDGSRG